MRTELETNHDASQGRLRRFAARTSTRIIYSISLHCFAIMKLDFALILEASKNRIDANKPNGHIIYNQVANDVTTLQICIFLHNVTKHTNV